MAHERLTIATDITEASTLPAEFYRDDFWYRECRERIFVPSWQLVAQTDQVKIPGQTLPITLLEGLLDEPLLLTRDYDDRLHCMSNVCTHRANLVCESAGVERHLRCRYHGRRFGLDGSFVSMPECEEAKNFPSKRDSLPTVQWGQLGPLLFASLGPELPFERWVEPVTQRIPWYPWNQLRFDPRRSRDYLVQAHWALYCDNYLEGFHIPYIHAGLAATLDFGKYRYELRERSSLQLGIGKPGDSAFDLPSTSPDAGSTVAAYYFFLFPNLMLNFYPWGLSVNVVKPLAQDRTRVSFLTFIYDESKLDRGAGSELDRVEREDELVVENVQRGLRSRLYNAGRFSPRQEQATHHFHALIAKSLERKT